jgi:PAS domain S-box-containing protein
MLSNLSQFQRHQLAIIARVTPYAMAGHMLNSTVAAVALAGSVPLAQLIIWCTYSYSIAFIVLYRHVKSRGHSPRNFHRAARRATIYALLLAAPWGSLAALHFGTLAQGEELILVALIAGMAASGTILLSAVPPAAFSYMSGILIPTMLKCLIFLDQKSYLLLGVLALSYWGFLTALIAKITHEIGERKRAEAAFMESEARYGALYEGNPSMYFTLDPAGIVHSINRFGAEQLGYTAAELVGQTVLRVIHEDDWETVRQQLALWAQYPATVSKTELRKVRRDGSILWVSEVGRAVQNSEGQTELLVVCEDITERKEAEVALKESEVRLQQALTAGQVMAFEWNADTRQSRRSDSAAQILGYEKASVASSRRDDFLGRIHADDRECFKTHLHQLCPENPSYSANFRFCRPDGRHVWLEETARGEFDASGHLLCIKGLTRDITERKKAEHALAERNMQLSLAGKAALVGSYAYDVKANMLQFSEGYAAIYDLPEGTREMTGSQRRTLVHPEDLERLDRVRSQAFEQWRGEFSLEYRNILPKRGVRWIESRSLIFYDSNSRPERVIGVNIDVTERKRAEQALAERNVQFTLAAKTGLVGSYAYDTDTEIMQISEGYAAIHGFPERTAEIDRSDCLATVHPDDVVAVKLHRSEAFHERRREYNLEYRIVRPGGEIRWVETRCFISYNGVGYPKRVVGVSIDITERKRVQEQQRALLAELDHRVKNTLATVSAIVSHTRDGSGSMVDFVTALDGRIRAMATTHELLSACRWQGVSLTELVRRELAPYAAGSNSAFKGPDVLLCPEAAQSMAMVLHELTTNAAKYGALSTKDGRVSVRWERRVNGQTRPLLVLDWQESGGPPVVAPGNASYGTSTIRDVIPYEFGGTVNFELAREGVRCRLELPADWLTNGPNLGTPPASAA